MHNPESVLKNEMHKPLWDLQIHIDHLISARRQYLVIINKKKRTSLIVDFVEVKLEVSEKKFKYLNFGRELKKILDMKIMVVPVVIGALATVNKGLVQGREDLEIRGQKDTKI